MILNGAFKSEGETHTHHTHLTGMWSHTSHPWPHVTCIVLRPGQTPQSIPATRQNKLHRHKLVLWDLMETQECREAWIMINIYRTTGDCCDWHGGVVWGSVQGRHWLYTWNHKVGEKLHFSTVFMTTETVEQSVPPFTEGLHWTLISTAK